MYLFKVSGATIENALKEEKFAMHFIPKGIKAGDLVLIAKNLQDLRPGEKSIQWVLEFVKAKLDFNHESDRIWQKHWKYLFIMRNRYRVSKPFNIMDISNSPGGSGRNYNPVMTCCKLDYRDVEIIKKYYL